jgi:NAD(P)-dependent dehydrogenase (short-subunit alcohol dehydrogenase family)
MPTYLIFGASSAIGQATISQLASRGGRVIAFSRQTMDGFAKQSNVDFIKLAGYETDDLNTAVAELIHNTYGFSFEHVKGVFIFNGILHSTSLSPEKSLSQFKADNFFEVLKSNTLVPITILQSVLPKLPKDSVAKIAVLSARIGSIDDNGLGGWHSYRASKAALNMLLKNVAIEHSRTHKNLKFVSYHPGTTDSELSKPFQANVPKDKLFTPAQSSAYLLAVLEQLGGANGAVSANSMDSADSMDNANGSLQRKTKHKNAQSNIYFLDWQGNTIAW